VQGGCNIQADNFGSERMRAWRRAAERMQPGAGAGRGGGRLRGRRAGQQRLPGRLRALERERRRGRRPVPPVRGAAMLKGWRSGAHGPNARCRAGLGRAYADSVTGRRRTGAGRDVASTCSWWQSCARSASVQGPGRAGLQHADCMRRGSCMRRAQEALSRPSLARFPHMTLLHMQRESIRGALSDAASPVLVTMPPIALRAPRSPGDGLRGQSPPSKKLACS
jgi:hypothetical protein